MILDERAREILASLSGEFQGDKTPIKLLLASEEFAGNAKQMLQDPQEAAGAVKALLLLADSLYFAAQVTPQGPVVAGIADMVTLHAVRIAQEFGEVPR